MEEGRYGEALAAYQAHPAEGTDPPALALTAAAAAARLGDLDLATTLAVAALDGFAAERDRHGWGRALNLLGAVHFERGAIDQADTCFGQALRLAREGEDALLTARASNNLGTVADLRGRSDLALSLYRAALLAYQGLNHRRGIAETCHNLGITLARLGALEDARESSARAVEEAETLGERLLLALSLGGVGERSLQCGDLEHAGRALEKAAQLAEEAGDGATGAEVARLRAVLSLRREAYQEAYGQADLACVGAERAGNALVWAESLVVQALALRGLERAEEAEARRAEARAALESLGAIQLQEEFHTAWLALAPRGPAG
jgi:tetratricopeptide repeat protein